MKKLLLGLTILLISTTCFSQLTKVSVGYINMFDTNSVKINWLTNTRTTSYILGTKLSPSFYTDVRDSGFGVTNLLAHRMLNYSGMKSLIQYSLDGTGTFSIGGRRSGDTTTAFSRMVRIDYDSTVLTNYLKLGSVSTEPTAAGMIHRNGVGDTLVYSFGSTPTIFRLFPGTQTSSHVLRYNGRYWTSSALSTGDLPTSLSADSVRPGYVFVNPTGADSCKFYDVEANTWTVYRISADVEGGTSATLNVVKVSGGVGTDLFSSNQTVSAASATAAWTNLPSFTATTFSTGDACRVSLRAIVGSPSKVKVRIFMKKAN